MTKKIIIVGGGFAGLNLAKNLSNNKHFEVTVVESKNNNQLWCRTCYYKVGKPKRIQ